jgi:hypothetical protein
VLALVHVWYCGAGCFFLSVFHLKKHQNDFFSDIFFYISTYHQKTLKKHQFDIFQSKCTFKKHLKAEVTTLTKRMNGQQKFFLP